MRTLRGKGLELAALFLAALNLRPSITSIGPVIEAIRADTLMSHPLAGLLTGIPVLCMGVLAPLAAPLGARRGPESATFWALALIAVATAARILGASPVLFFTAFLSGCGIAIAGPLLGAFIKRHFASNVALVSGIYSCSLTIGAALSAGLTAPIATLPGSSWELALAVWSIPAMLACLAWRAVARQSAAASGGLAPQSPVSLPWRHGKAWLLVLLFGFQSQIFYATVAWLAPMYMDLGWSEAAAGALLSVLVAVQAVAALGLSAAAGRTRDRRPWLLLTILLSLLSLLGLAMSPQSVPWIWMTLLGIGTGGLFALGLILPLDYSETPGEAGAWTAMMLSGGYIIASVSPFVAGSIRSFTGSYAGVFYMLSGIAALLVLIAVFLDPPRRSA